VRILKQIVSFIFLVALQVLIFNNILFAGYLNPYIYLIFILFLPVITPRAYVLLLAFVLGFTIDLFENSGGVHIAATVFLAFVRPVLLQISSRKQGSDFEELKIRNLETANFLVYAILAIFVHHFVLFTIEAYDFARLGTVLARTALSSAFTLLFVFLWRLWDRRKKD